MKQTINHARPTSHNPFAQSTTQTWIESDQLSEAVVVDIIVNDEHPEYKSGLDGYNVGCAKVRLLRSGQFKDDSSLHWTRPIESNITEYPLIGEIVVVQSLLNKFFYLRKLNISSKITIQTLSKLNDEFQPIVAPAAKSSGLESTKSVPNKQIASTPTLGKYFKDQQSYRLKNFEGDLIIEGRTGTSIRFGNSFRTNQTFQSTEADQSPILLLRAGQSPTQVPTTNTQFGLILEDIDGDASSIWMVADQIVPIRLSTASDKKVHRKSIPDFPSILDKSQIVISSDRIVVNSRLDKVMIHAGNGLHLTSLKNVSIDTSQDYFSWIGRDRKIEINGSNTQNVQQDLRFWVRQKASIFSKQELSLLSDTSVLLRGKQVFIGGTSGAEHMVLGDSLTQLLTDIVDAFLTSASRQVITSTGPGRMNPAIQIALNQIKSKLRSKIILSKDNFIVSTNTAPAQKYISLH